MKIVYDHQIFSAQRYGGVSRYIYEIARNVSLLGSHDVEIFAPLHINQYLGGSSLAGVNKLRHFQNGVFKSAINSIDHYLGNWLVRPRKDVQIFHETYYATRTYAPSSSKRIVTVHDMIHELFPKSFGPNNATTRIKKHAVQRADHVICVSHNTRRDLMEIFGTPAEKISVTYLGHSLIPSLGENEIALQKKPFLLFVGNRGGYKNFDRFFRAYAQSTFLSREFSLLCFGGGRFSSHELSLIESLGVPKGAVTWIEGNDAILSDLYSEAALLVYPSLYEGFGIPPLEAMAHGCPVACTRTSSLPEIVGDAAEQFNPTEQDAIQAAVEGIVSSPSRMLELAALGRRQASLFSWEKCARATLGAYETALAT